MRRSMLRRALRQLGVRGDMEWVRKNRKILAGFMSRTVFGGLVA